MMLPQRKNFFTPSQFAIASAGVLGTNQKYALDRTWPIEEIILHVDVTLGAAGATPRTGSTAQIGLDALLGVVKRVNLTINDGVQPRSIVDFSGVGLLEYAHKVGLNIDAATLEAIRLWQLQVVYPNNLKLRYSIRIPLVHPLITEPLRTRCLLPVHIFPQDPILSLDFESSSNMISAGAVSAVVVTVDLIRREMSQQTTKDILANGGFIASDLIETPFSVGTGISGEQRFPVPLSGKYLNLLFRQYLGGATVSRSELDQVTTYGNESKWRLESGGVAIRDWRWQQIRVINQWSQVLNGCSQSGLLVPGSTAPFWVAASSAGAVTTAMPVQIPSPSIEGFLNNDAAATPLQTGTFRPASSCLLDFLTDGLDSANELGSVLDCDFPAQSGLKMEVVGPVASVATAASTFFMGGHRLYGNEIIKRFQAVRL